MEGGREAPAPPPPPPPRIRKRPRQPATATGTAGRALEEVLLGGVSTALACCLSNPFDVLKVRMQLQGELQGKGTYQVHYRNVFHAAWTIARTEGLLALQKGLGPAVVYQFVMNGTRLGLYQTLVNTGFTRSKAEVVAKGSGGSSISSGVRSSSSSEFARSVLAGALGGGLGGLVASPLYLVKTQLQAMSRKEIAVGHQYSHRGMWHALRQTYRSYGVKGLWRGVEGAVPRLTLGSALQLSTFAHIKARVKETGYLSEAWVPVAASLVSSVQIVVFMEPLDVVRTRLYNQPVDAQGRGLLYAGFTDCFAKMYANEGLHGFYKGAWAAYFRMAPQAVLGLSFWDSFRRVYYRRRVEREGEGDGGEEEQRRDRN